LQSQSHLEGVCRLPLKTQACKGFNVQCTFSQQLPLLECCEPCAAKSNSLLKPP
jgi:hypothetical protein